MLLVTTLRDGCGHQQNDDENDDALFVLS